MHHHTRYVSCTLKHLLIYEQIAKSNLDGALVIEDDIVFYHNFPNVLARCLAEFNVAFRDSPSIIAFDESSLRIVPRSQRHRGQYLYPAHSDRFGGCYFVTRQCAVRMLEIAKSEKLSLPIDGWHCYLTHRGDISYFWSHPAIAVQGDFIGFFPSEIHNEKFNRIKLLSDRIRFFFKRTYKLLLYNFR